MNRQHKNKPDRVRAEHQIITPSLRSRSSTLSVFGSAFRFDMAFFIAALIGRFFLGLAGMVEVGEAEAVTTRAAGGKGEAGEDEGCED